MILGYAELGTLSAQLGVIPAAESGETAPGDEVTTANAYFRRTVTGMDAAFARAVTGSDATFRRTVTTSDAER